MIGSKASDVRFEGRHKPIPGGLTVAVRTTDVKLGLLDEGTVTVDGVEIDRCKYLATVLEDHIQYRNNERDIVLVRIEVMGEKNGKKVRSVYQVIDKGVLSPAKDVPYELFKNELSKRNIEITESITKI